MSNKKFSIILMALVAMSCFKPSFSLAQINSPQTPATGTSSQMPNYKIKTPNTKDQLKEDKSAVSSKVDETEDSSSSENDYSAGPAPRRLQQHGIGIGLGETFLLGNYGKHGADKITLDLLYSYAASHSFDLLIDAHMSEHKDKSERVKVMGISSSIKARFVEYDNFSPFVLGGLGFYAPQAKRRIDGDTKWSDQKITFGINFGGGVDLRLNDHYVVGVLGQMHWPFAVDQDKGSDLKGYYFKLLITGMYLF